MFLLVSVHAADQAGLSLAWSETLKAELLASQPKLYVQAVKALVILYVYQGSS